MKKHNILIICLMLIILSLIACQSTTEVITTTNGNNGQLIWDGEEIHYQAENIRNFGSATPSGVANYNLSAQTVSIWNTDASLDNYGGIQTPSLALDFSKAVIFEMEVESVYSEYIVKLAVEGESEYYYVISDEDRTGKISVNVVDSMLSEKYRTKNTQPNPGYQTGWKYDNQVKNCSFHILAKGPDGERQTAELVVKSIAIYNNQKAITGVELSSDLISNQRIDILKGSNPVTLTATVSPVDVSDRTVFWVSSDEGIATVSESGQVTAVGVGETVVRAVSNVDQSKYAEVLVNVTSGYEEKEGFLNLLDNLEYQGSASDIGLFIDLFRTKVEDSQEISVSPESFATVAYRYQGQKLFIENYFDKDNTNDVDLALDRISDNKALLNIDFNHSGSATIYYMVNDKLYRVNSVNEFNLAYAENSSEWNGLSANYKLIIVWDNDDINQFEIELFKTSLIGEYDAQDLADSDIWIIPDRTKQDEDSVIHALSPATVTLQGATVSIKQNKYPESKYSFGGIVSPLYNVETGKQVEIILDVEGLNHMNDFVKTMWEIKVIYYQSNGETVVNSNPLKVESGNTIGEHIVRFTPAYTHFRIYFVVNGSDIGAQFADATMIIESFKLYQID